MIRFSSTLPRKVFVCKHEAKRYTHIAKKIERKEEMKKYYVVDCSRWRLHTLHSQTSHFDQHEYSLIALRTDSSCLIIFGAIIISAVVKCAIAFTHGPPTTLILKMPIKANERAMLIAFVLQERLALLHAEFLQVAKEAKGLG